MKKLLLILLCLPLFYSCSDTKENTNNSEDKKTITYYPQPENGHSPYDAYFGKGIYNNNTKNAFIIKNDNILSK